MTQTAYLAPEGFEADLEKEISLDPELTVTTRMERLFIVQGPAKPLSWAQNIWLNPQQHSIGSISQGAQILRDNGKLWAPYSHTSHRRLSLIQEKLPKVFNKPMSFGQKAPDRQLGGWTLQDDKTLWLSQQTNSPFPCGEVFFNETQEAPSRAYQKLWEFFTVTGQAPKVGETCLDLGSSPGGWTWVLAELGCQVISVDKAPLAPHLLKNSKIKSLKKDAFTLKPEDTGPVDWLFSDIICYPQRLLELVQVWLKSGLAKNFVCTIKFQGETDFQALRAFRAIPGSQIRHLFVNKHEVTWSLIGRQP
jgi:23S rRNA (cytidine2498-2'-O)-methyltransferase